MKPRILFLSHEEGKGIGGSTYSLYHLIEGIRCEADVIIVSRRGDALDFFKSHEINCFELKLPMRLQVWYKNRSFCPIIERSFRILYNYTLNMITSLYLSCKFRGKVDIIHTNSTVLDIGLFLARLLSVKHVWHLREFCNLDHDMEPLLGWRWVYYACQKSDAVICISKAIAEHYKMKTNHVICDAICSKKAMKPVLYPKEKFFLYAGGGKLKKGILDAIRVFNKFSSFHPDYKLLITGNNVQDIVSDYLENNSRIELLGYRSDLEDLMRRATAYLMCSHNEALGRVTLEAMAAGCPVIGYAAGATKEIIQDGVTGWLYVTDNDFLACMEEIVNHTEEVVLRINNARKIIKEEFSEEEYSNKVLDLYNNILDNGG